MLRTNLKLTLGKLKGETQMDELRLVQLGLFVLSEPN
jgi:hypothetical protein